MRVNLPIIEGKILDTCARKKRLNKKTNDVPKLQTALVAHRIIIQRCIFLVNKHEKSGSLFSCWFRGPVE